QLLRDLAPVARADFLPDERLELVDPVGRDLRHKNHPNARCRRSRAWCAAFAGLAPGCGEAETRVPGRATGVQVIDCALSTSWRGRVRSFRAKPARPGHQPIRSRPAGRAPARCNRYTYSQIVSSRGK